MTRRTALNKIPLLAALALLLTLSGCDEVVLFDAFRPGELNQEFPTRVLVRPDDGSGGYEPPANAGGKDWDSAFINIQTAINYAAAHGIDEVWVAGGMYNLTEPISPFEGVSLYGGFKVGDVFRDDRQPHKGGRTTTLIHTGSGNLLSLNSVFSRQLIIDGFTFTGDSTSSIAFGNGASPTIRNCRFTQNSPPTANSNRALYFMGAATSPLIEDCWFTGFHTSNYVVYLNGTCHPVFVGCHFYNNRSTGYGGAIYTGMGANLTLIGCVFENNETTLSGGAIYLGETNTAHLTRCTFYGNSATGNGGAIRIASGSTGTLTDCTFINNSSTGDGGALFIENINDLTFTGCTFTGNYTTKANEGGGAISCKGSVITINNCRFTGNGIDKEGETVTQYGGAIFLGDTSLSGSGITCGGETIFTGNKSTTEGGAVYGISGSRARTFDRCTFTGNQSGQNGGAVSFYNCDGANTFIDCLFKDNSLENTTNAYGGAVSLTDTTPATFTQCRFERNTITVTSGTPQGGGLYNGSSRPVTFTNCTNGGGNLPNYIYPSP